MERPSVVGHPDETELYPTGGALPDGQQTYAATAFLQDRFQGHCPHHLLHNLLNLHYGQHPLCTAPPFTNAVCRYGSHERPVLSVQDMMATAPARGAVIFLPFGLSCRAANDGSCIVDGCIDCELLDVGDTCGSCRRFWHGEGSVPANASTGYGGSHASLAAWLAAAVHLPGHALGEAGEEEWENTWDDQEGQEEYGEEEYGEEDEGYLDDAHVWHPADDWGCQNQEEEEGQEGEEGWKAEGNEDQQPPSFDVGHWAEDSQGDWTWSWFAQQPAAVRAADAGLASAPAAAPPADASLATAVAAAVQATLVVCGAGSACATQAEPSSDADWHVRTLELELEMAKLKRKRTD
jgi:hypothetical protein